MRLEELKLKIKEFEAKAGFDKTEFSKLMEMMQEELDVLKANSDNKEIVNHQLTDLLVLIMQVAHRYDVDFNVELEEWFKKSEKYIK
jgi:NTP pyrophosphatase (non-canonical NTP hydrolase)